MGPADTNELHYDAPSGCPDKTALLRAIHDRAPQGYPSADNRAFHVRIERAGDELHGRLEIERNGHVLSVREIRDTTCEVVTTAVAVFIALALDPATESPTTEEPEPPEQTVPTPAPPPSPPPPNPCESSPTRDRCQAGIGDAGSPLSSVFHPSPALGGRVHAGGITRFAPGALLAPELRLSWGWSQLTESPPRGGGQVSFPDGSGYEACVLFGLAPLVAAPCVGFEAGQLGATTRNLPHAGGTNESWYAPTAIVRPGWFLADWLSLEAEVGVLFPMTRASSSSPTRNGPCIASRRSRSAPQLGFEFGLLCPEFSLFLACNQKYFRE